MTTDVAIRVSLAVLGVLAAADALALDPLPVKLGPVEFIPTVGLAQGYDDNAQQAPNGQEITSAVTRVTPTLLFRARERANRYELGYRGAYDFYASGGVGDRMDHHLLANSHLEFAARHRLDLTAGFDHIQDIQNLTNRQYNESGNVYNTFQVGALYGFGARSSKAQLEVGANYKWMRYLNNLNSGSMNIAQDYNSPGVTATLYYRIAPKTRLLTEIDYHQFDYTWSASTLDSYSLKYLAGVTWQATAKTRGIVKVGYQQKTFRSGVTGTVGFPSADAAITWTPTTRAEFTLSASSYIGEGGLYKNYIDTQLYRESAGARRRNNPSPSA